MTRIEELMESSGVRFGTSGARGLVTDMTDAVCYAYTLGFLNHLEARGELDASIRRVAVAGDLRPSTGRIMGAVARAIADRGLEVLNSGRVPSSAVALLGMRERIPAIMVTGSHIPDDRNGIKYNKPTGEILKEDEAGIRAQEPQLPDIFDGEGMFRTPAELPPVDRAASEVYLARWLEAFPADFLAGKRLGLYEHSAVGRDLLYQVYTALGAEVVRLGRSESFIPVDTEAIRPEDSELALNWAKERAFDTIVSTDGDSDRPLMSDENGNWLRGDVAGILTAGYFGADSVVTPVSCNTAVEKCGWFDTVRRTRIGSPYVIADMLESSAAGAKRVVGYEANGGFLTASSLAVEGGGTLEPLPTRDPVIVHLGILGLSRREGLPISRLLEKLPPRFTASDRLKDFPTERSREKIAELIDGGDAAIESNFAGFGKVIAKNTIDGLRITFDSQDVVHLRPSGNAPELRCYSEAESDARALDINQRTLAVLESWR